MLPPSTQGAFWPPAEVVDADGNFVLVGNVLTEIQPGVSVPVPNGAVLVSKNTVPALRPDGVEDVDGWFAAGYDVIRPLDLSPGSPDLDIVLYSNSFGPWDTPSGAPRIPAEGESPYNLNSDLVVCPETAPTASQRAADYRRPSFPLNEVPIYGFQGDGVRYDADDFSTFDPMQATGCGQLACPGEDAVDERPFTEPVTLGRWLQSRANVKVQLVNFDEELGAYTAARFTFKLKNMLPYGIYTIWAVRLRTVPIPGIAERRDIDPLHVPNLLVADEKGRAEGSFVVSNPFPDAATDVLRQRIIGLSIVYHSDQQTWGACFSKYGPGVDIHVVFNSLIDGTSDLAPDFITKSR